MLGLLRLIGCYRKAIQVFQLVFSACFHQKNMECGCFKQWYKNYSTYILIIIINNRNYNFKGIIDNHDFCHNRAALIVVMVNSSILRHLYGQTA